jgi:hypothetical protein
LWKQFLYGFYGLLEIGIEIPESKYEYFGSFPPIFQNIEISDELSGEYMKEVILNAKGKFSTSVKLVASMAATRKLISSTQLKWLIEKGAIVTKLYGVIPAERGRPFKEFVQWVSDERRKGDVESKYAIIADAAKLVGNSAYGRTMMNKNAFNNVKFLDEKQFNRAKNNYFFRDADEFDGTYEVSSRPRKVKQNIPIQVAFQVLDYAKLHMLQFNYDCIDKYIDRSDYQFMYMDTDSCYMALSGEFNNLIKPKLRDEFEKEKDKWFPRSDTQEHIQYDKRKPGLFKIEYEGEGMVALSSKTYHCWNDCSADGMKTSCKGIQKSKNKELMNRESYKTCLVNKTPNEATNSGFRYIKGDHTMRTYEQHKVGLSPIYTKGVVMRDGVHIHCLPTV